VTVLERPRAGRGPGAGSSARPLRRDVVVLCYHAVSEHWPAALAVTTKSLETQLRVLLRRGYRGASFTDAVLDPPYSRTVAVTFDDAFRSVLELAFPVLSELGLPGTVFVPTSFPDRDEPMAWPGIDEWRGGPHESELRPMSWNQLATLATAGWEVGSHTRTHPRLTSLSDDDLAEELRESRIRCADVLGHPCRSIAYPYGDVDQRVVASAAQAGYEAGAALPIRFDSNDPLCWPRVGVYRSDSLWRYRAKVSRVVRRVRATGLWTAGG
jgi:peptidoglycan/xylan/chitin deacetylase (PgdA/CDA1 family)